MSEPPLLDTHAWIWWLDGDARLGRETLKALGRFAKDLRPAISAISLWEAARLHARGRLALRTTFDAWVAIAADPGTVRVVSISPQIAAEVARLPDSLPGDPADRLIVATARVHGLRLLTKDAVIAKSGLVRLWSAATGPTPADF